MENKGVGILALGLGAVLGIGTLVLVAASAKAAPPEAPPGTVVIKLKNVPTGADVWQCVLCDQDLTVGFYARESKENNTLNIGNATFDIPEGTAFPLKFILLQVGKWENEAITVLYEMQSYMPFQPNYREVFIPDYGGYIFNCGTEQLEV
jgi:hypothetical protein